RVVGDRLSAFRPDVATGAVDQDVDRAELGDDVVLHLLDGGGVADVADDRAGAGAELLHCLRHHAEVGGFAVLRGRGPVGVVKGNVGASPGKPLSHLAAEAAARPGYECNFSAQLLRHDSSPFVMDKLLETRIPTHRAFGAVPPPRSGEGLARWL